LYISTAVRPLSALNNRIEAYMTYVSRFCLSLVAQEAEHYVLCGWKSTFERKRGGGREGESEEEKEQKRENKFTSSKWKCVKCYEGGRATRYVVSLHSRPCVWWSHEIGRRTKV